MIEIANINKALPGTNMHRSLLIMQKCICKLFLLGISLLISTQSQADGLPYGSYESLDGKFHHTFKATGDYIGRAVYGETEYSSEGLYEIGDGICWVTANDGSKGALGNVLLYVDEAQCCLEFRSISNKFAVSKVWVKGTGTGYAVCQNQVLIMKSK